MITPRRCLAITLVLSGAGVLYLTAVSSLGMAWAIALMFGIFPSPEDSLQGMVLAQYFGRDSYGTILGFFAPFQIGMLG